MNQIALKLGELLPSCTGYSENKLTNGFFELLLASCLRSPPSASYFLPDSFDLDLDLLDVFSPDLSGHSKLKYMWLALRSIASSVSCLLVSASSSLISSRNSGIDSRQLCNF